MISNYITYNVCIHIRYRKGRPKTSVGERVHINKLYKEGTNRPKSRMGHRPIIDT